MRFLLDESADFRLAAFLTGRGHDVTTVVRDHPRALKDREVLAIARRGRRVLITNDTDFGELIYRQRVAHAGVILFRLKSEDLSSKCAWLDRVLEQFPEQLDQFLVISDSGVRIRRSRS